MNFKLLFQIEGNLATIPIGAVVVTDASFAKGKHVIDFQVFSGSAVIGAGKSNIVTQKKKQKKQKQQQQN